MSPIANSSTLMALAWAVAGCASKSLDVEAAYVSPIAYENYSCAQLTEEARMVADEAARAAGKQDKKRTSDAVVTTVGIVIFWPALVFIKGDDATTAKLSRLKGEMEAIEKASRLKGCKIRFQTE